MCAAVNEYTERKETPAYHPAYVLRRLNGEIMDQFVRDIQEAAGLALVLRWPAFLNAYRRPGSGES
jgi:hypothetical protein